MASQAVTVAREGEELGCFQGHLVVQPGQQADGGRLQPLALGVARRVQPVALGESLADGTSGDGS